MEARELGGSKDCCYLFCESLS